MWKGKVDQRPHQKCGKEITGLSLLLAVSSTFLLGLVIAATVKQQGKHLRPRVQFKPQFIISNTTNIFVTQSLPAWAAPGVIISTELAFHFKSIIGTLIRPSCSAAPTPWEGGENSRQRGSMMLESSSYVKNHIHTEFYKTQQDLTFFPF